MLEKNFNDVVDDKDIYIKEDEEKDADNISINSIVSDQPEFDSDTEIPKDKEGQEDKIILNHVVKRIVVPGYGLDKPSKHDFLHIKYKCYFKEDKNIIIENSELSDYMYKIKLPLGITKAIKCMRKGEESIIKLEPKYGFKKVNFDDLNRFCEIDKIKINLNINKDEYIKCLFDKMQKNTLIYEIILINYVKLFDLTGNKNLLKRIINEGIGLDKPYTDSEIIIKFKLIQNGEKIIELENVKSKLNEEFFTYAECVIIKSMKKKEKCFIEIKRDFFIENLNNCNKEKNIIYNYLKEKNIINNILDLNDKEYKRYQYEIELIKFKNNISTIYYKDKEYTKEIISKGIGNCSPFRDALIMMPFSVKINNKLIYSDFELVGYKNENDFFQKIKIIKKKIKQIPSYEEKAQFLIEDELNKENLKFNIYDKLTQNFPNVFRKEILQTLKPLSIFKLYFELNKNIKDELEQNYFIFINKDLNFFKNELSKEKQDKINIEFTACLLNFEDYINVFNNNLIEDKVEKISEYKNISNNFFSQGYLHKAKKIYKNLTKNYLKHLSLGTANKEKIGFNKKEVKNINYISDIKDNVVNDEENKFDDNIKEITKSKNFEKNIDEYMKKIFRNLIVVLYKLNLKEECLKYCNIFLRLYLNDEKVYYFLFVINKERGNFNICKTILEKMIELYNKDENKLKEYKVELDKIQNILNKNKTEHNNYMKKMMKNV
mgnify:CR=1 FL=1